MTDRRTPLARARGLGSAKEGVHHWWAQRLTAIALIPLVVWFAISLVMLMLILTIGIGLHHGQLGMQVVWEDYTEGAVRVVMIVLTKFLAVLFGLGAIVAVLRIGFGG